VFGVGATTVATVLAVLFVGGVVMGIAGFGYALVGTATLAALLDPATAVVVMILPMLATNVQLLTELDRESLSTCFARFRPYLAAAIVGTLLGMVLLDRIPSDVLALALGVLTLGYVGLTQPYVTVPGRATATDYCFRPTGPAKAALGFVSGIVFGASNVAVQTVAYLDSLELGRSTFVGVLAMVLVGISVVRVVAAWLLGLYDAPGALSLSLLGIVPGLVGVAAGQRVRSSVPERARTAGTLLLLGVIGVRLTAKGL
jgi:uncharacterized membrane protein YfcA